MNKNNILLEVKNLTASFEIPDKKTIIPVNNISFTISKNETVGFVGESGSGKSSLAYCITQLLAKNAKIIGGSIKFDNQELINLKLSELQKIRGAKIAIIPQNPMSSFDPIYTIEKQMNEMFMNHLKTKIDSKKSELFQKIKELEKTKEIKSLDEQKKISLEILALKKEAKNYTYNQSIQLLKLVGINDAEKRIKQYPSELSGGMLQRVMIAMNLICEPSLLIADEPTTALDVTVQMQIITLLKTLQSKMHMGIMIITHDLGIIANMCDTVHVMYAGSIVESGSTEDIFQNPKHEYTKKLMLSTPKFDTEKLESISGYPPALSQLNIGCAFAERCEKCMEICLKQTPFIFQIENNHYSTCFKYLYEKYKNNHDELKKILNLNGIK
ncbi:MAG: ABC transporter ATP-binding protein [Bacilli bacterium]|nr:ABC transporter ATP-binding protein [Bacilli bacterium]